MKVAVVTISDSVAQGTREDASGPAVAARCGELKWAVASKHVLADDRAQIEGLLRKIADEGSVDAIFTTGGTGLGPRDCTPEATQAVGGGLISGMAGEMGGERGGNKTRGVLL